MTELLSVENMVVGFEGASRPTIGGISFTLRAGQRLGLIGESGSGKSVTALALMGLLPDTAHLSGSVRLAGRELVGLGDAKMARIRGREMSMVFQEPMTALDPTMRVGRQVAEVVRLHCARTGSGHTRERVCRMLEEVGLPDAERIADSYPFQLSGGQRQRVMVAMALINRPELIICDEPTTALDVTVQARVLDVLDRGLREVGAACLFISHDLAVVSQICDDVIVMYRGQIVEAGPVAVLLDHARHPYTRGLVATARLDEVAPGARLRVIEDFWDASQERR
ncbi:ABC-type dipeptide/oligopeptide/nickel transport system, ATPase component [Propionibacterium cyclohexanicum]|uniref:ABC-type dipeptide/oligopeptide/nickel transport system, ATPase component n=1 Tax=Propionibacterium cyclohexanicum TaxID=64702 RepID=A0A1H9R0R3_9ACTN|nr:ABC-type dipeptide/oligopeptide/nickel transport system, ATPase component [Propionibacterium cyclohexanicum]